MSLGDSLKSISVDDKNPIYSSVKGILFEKSKDKPIYTPRALLFAKQEKVWSVSDLARLTDEEIISEICMELGYECETIPDDDWECADSMFEWIHRDFSGYHMKIHAFTDGNRVTKLSFSGLDITKLPVVTGWLSALKVLDLSHTKMEVLPE